MLRRTMIGAGAIAAGMALAQPGTPGEPGGRTKPTDDLQTALDAGSRMREDAVRSALEAIRSGDAVKAVLGVHRAESLGATVEGSEAALDQLKEEAVRGALMQVRTMLNARELREANLLLAQVRAVVDDPRLQALQQDIHAVLARQHQPPPDLDSRLRSIESELTLDETRRRSLEEGLQRAVETNRDLSRQIESIMRDLDNHGRAESIIDTLKRRMESQEREIQRLERDVQRLEREVQRLR